jgi:hypothetical protein
MDNNVSVGPTTVAGGSVSIAGFAVAVIAFANGARDEETFSALAVGGAALFTTLAGRFAQAIAQALRARPVDPTSPIPMGEAALRNPGRAPAPRRKPKGV